MTQEEREQDESGPQPEAAAAAAEQPEAAAPAAEQPEAAAPAAEQPEAAAPAAEQPEAAAPAAERPAGDGERPRPERGEGDRPRGGERRRRHFGRRKVCAFCVEKATEIDYKDAGKLRRYLSDRGRIDARRKTGTCTKHQRWLATALKRARHLALLPYSPEHIRVTGMFAQRR